MCQDHHNVRTGARLRDGSAHAADHEQWTRRQFISALGLGGAGAFLGGALPVRAVMGAPVIHPLASASSDRIIVLVQLEGGNDGLNTVIPVEDDRYYRNRPILSIPKSAARDVGQEYRLNGALDALLPDVSSGRVQIVHGVGYENPDLSHFRSTDIWVSGSDSNQTVQSGWMGRTLEGQWPEILLTPPTSPLAVQIGGAATMFRGNETNVGASFRNTDQLERLTRGGAFYDPADVPDTRFGELMAFAREVANRSYRYASALEAAASAGSNGASYPGGGLSEQLAMVARLIKGNLGARVYHVSLSGFDTHSFQDSAHPALLSEFAGATSAFMEDLAGGGRGQDVLIMTFSEFGRTVSENGSRGTDHATVAPLFLMGDGLAGASFGAQPDLDIVNEFGDLQHIIDFRRVYATVLEQWLRIPAGVVNQALGNDFERLDLFASSVGSEAAALPHGFRVGAAYPNPASSVVRIPIAAPPAARISWALFDGLGRRVNQASSRAAVSGESELAIPVGQLANGRYFVRLQIGGQFVTRTVIVGG